MRKETLLHGTYADYIKEYSRSKVRHIIIASAYIVCVRQWHTTTNVQS